MRLAIAALLAGCAAEFPPLEPDDRGAPRDARLGVELFRTPQGLRIAALYQDDGLLLVFEETNVGWHARHVDPLDGAVAELPAPPLRPRDRIEVGRTHGGAPPTIATAHDGVVEVHVLEGDGWTTLPPLPVGPSVIGDVGQLLAHDGAIWITAAGRAFAWNGAAWAEPLIAPGPIALGAFDGARQLLLAGDGGDSFTAHVVDGGVAGAGVAAPAGAGLPQPSSINGTIDATQIVAGGVAWTFDGATFTAGDAIAGAPWSAPGSPAIIVSDANGADGTWWRVAGGAVAEVVLAPFVAEVACCDGCACEPHEVGFLTIRPSPAAERIALVTADPHDGYGVLGVRFVALPASDPWPDQ